MSEDFFSRWSRRKREVRKTEKAEPRPPEPAEAEAADAGAEQAAQPEPELPPKALQDLPALEDLTPETDLSAFFRKEVPQALRNAALRRMWSLDPAIRDYVGDARDYAWDWNTPGDVPGYGPLAPTDEVYATLERMFSPAQSREAGRAPDAEDAAALGHSVAPQGGQASRPERELLEPESGSAGFAAPQQGLPEPSPTSRDAGSEEQAAFVAPDDGQAGNVAAPQQPEPALVRARSRRHGGAMPD